MNYQLVGSGNGVRREIFDMLCVMLKELLGSHDDMEQQLGELTSQLSQAEERRLAAVQDMEAMKVTPSHSTVCSVHKKMALLPTAVLYVVYICCYLY